ncbi:hypothetical protein C672_3545 [[Clostridium] bifermentans ATCC 638]|uniref:DUF4320 family protein n=1 Tax=Paraclostridium bifermentans ATCC 638 = DSM 14991 TaxID=1233171 RepID=T4VEN5_PARBF|nr:hypothetical protein [Paraclostridium bifermentans]EQK39983.1 hypothetical protein C672_3545 [[Clostridium] bifermentans ATCC 638] [Paraclostridium bifermentans ATCC 638 = DSM 14991]RIZ57386.1 hypothetical protein CHH45_16570 [Paraclostridium bifermentans]UAG19937.1 hypothetical protein KXZ80_17185 [Paraclostridium bifermentans]
MIESSIMASVKLYIFAILVTFIVSIGIFVFEIGQVHNYQSYVDTQIERNGGLTDKAMANINTYNEKNYKGKFTINSDQMNQKFAYGSIINYQIVGKYKLLFLDFDTQSYPVNGSSISLIR